MLLAYIYIIVRIFGKGIACSLLQSIREKLGLNNSVMDHVGVDMVGSGWTTVRDM